ncbi:MAG: hypothetical protein EPO51_26350 [Phenylobacterium sp.]|uniref:hypothetical protein n=1 Tax=Phenylobacterium sp. TaxID=1871053 RepID=UPI001229A210|nr:hypothetical protein [Phenylobacterium sp.]TAJ68416.1 MAG: hypothetical protein EPO51_26350 [Phenylobacterium sp.]
MRRAFALATALTLIAGAASAETWTKYVDGANGTAWSYDGDYSYKDKATGRLVVMQAISKPEAKLGPSAPGKPDGVGSVVAIDCAKKNLILLGSYKPSAPLAIKEEWRKDTPKKAEGADNAALMAAVCPHIDHVPVK